MKNTLFQVSFIYYCYCGGLAFTEYTELTPDYNVPPGVISLSKVDLDLVNGGNERNQCGRERIGSICQLDWSW